ncbi:hypothetical protein BZA77DRAFT_324875 [Pyronema omphalodes]|nr:hypothetical protein BZA77DRAFT_324875 [Pyronema omphalodes]
MEALFLDVGTGDHGPLPIRKCRKHRAMMSWAIRGLTDTKPPVSEIENKCNLGRNEKIYYRLDVQYPATWKFVQTHHYKMIPQIKTHVSESVLRDDLRSIIEEASKRMVELIRGEYNNKGDFETIQDRICDPCNRADPKAAVCFFNPLNEEFFRDQVTCPSMMPYTSQNLPEYFDKFKSASETITKWYPNGRDCTMAHMETAIHDLREVLRMLQSKFKEARHDQSILSEFILTIFKLSIAHGLAGATEEKTRMKNIIKASTAIMLGRKHHYPNFIDPCQWFTIKRNERHQ